MKRFILIHHGFEKPSPDVMEAWKRWFESIQDRTIENGGFHSGGREITHDGIEELPFGPDSWTGYSMIEAEDLDEATRIAQDNPFIKGIRVYEVHRQ